MRILKGQDTYSSGLTKNLTYSYIYWLWKIMYLEAILHKMFLCVVFEILMFKLSVSFIHHKCYYILYFWPNQLIILSSWTNFPHFAIKDSKKTKISGNLISRFTSLFVTFLRKITKFFIENWIYPNLISHNLS